MNEHLPPLQATNLQGMRSSCMCSSIHIMVNGLPAASLFRPLHALACLQLLSSCCQAWRSFAANLALPPAACRAAGAGCLPMHALLS
jgi:hypothetical protein